MRSSLRALLSILVVSAASGCGAPTCPPHPTSRPKEPTTLSWLDGTLPRVAATVDGRPFELLVDTGFPRTSLGPPPAGELDLASFSVEVGGARTDALAGDLLPLSSPGTGVLGNDVLSQLPLRFDARERQLQILSTFERGDETAPLLEWIRSDACKDDRRERGGVGLDFYAVRAMVEGVQHTFVLDTGAEASFVRRSVLERLEARAVLPDVFVQTGFAGIISAAATRARSVEIGEARSENSLVLAAIAVDYELDRMSQAVREAPSCNGGQSCPDLTLDGFLGWSFLREFKVSLVQGGPDQRERRLSLDRFVQQDHWKREFVGIGIYSSRSEEPAGLRVEGFFHGSSAKDAGLLGQDVILSVNGVPALQAPSPFGPVGSRVQLEVARGTERLSYEVEIQDLLPNP